MSCHVVRWSMFFVFALLLSFFSALFSVGLGYNSIYTPISHKGAFVKIYGDSWLEDGATISLADLSQRGNRLDLTFNPWRPADLENAHIKAFVCGELVSDFKVDSEQPYPIYLKGNCEPRKIFLKVENPFSVSGDSRSLGVQLKIARLTSRLGIPILSWKIILPTFLAILVLTLLVISLLKSLRLKNFYYGVLLCPLLAPLFFESATLFRVDKLTALFIFCLSCIVGLSLKLREKDFYSQEKNSFLIKVGMFLVIILAACLRYYGVNFGLPFYYHPDEMSKCNVVMSMYNSGTLNPNYFLHPSLLLYLTYFSNIIVNWILNLFEQNIAWQDSLLLAGRLVSATAGTASVYLVYLIGKRLFSEKMGFIAASFFAVMPLHVTCSRYIKEDALLIFFILSAVVVCLKAVYEDKKKLLFVASFLAGCSAGVKYSGILSALIVCAAPWLKSGSLKPDKKWLLVTLLSLICVPLAFLVCTPYSILNSERFLKDFHYEKNHMQKGHVVSIDAWSYFWLYHFKRSIIPGASMLITLSGVAGIFMLLRSFKIKYLYLVALFLLFYLPAEYVKAKPAPQPERYILPCLPFLALASACFIQKVFQKNRLLLSGAFILLFIPPFIRTYHYASEIVDDTRTRMYVWIKNNLPKGSKIAIDKEAYSFPAFSEKDFNLHFLEHTNYVNNLSERTLKPIGANYLLLSSLFYGRFFSQPESLPLEREQIRKVFSTYPIVHEEKSKYGSYGFHNPDLTLFSLEKIK